MKDRIRRHWRSTFVVGALCLVSMHVVATRLDLPWWIKRIFTSLSGADG